MKYWRHYKRMVRMVFTPKVDHHYVPDIYGRSASKMVDIRWDKEFKAMADEARKNGRTLLYYDRLHTLYQAIRNIARNKPAQDQKIRILEVGVYKGGGSYFMARCANHLFVQNITIEQFAVDTFGGHDAKDIPKGADGVHTPGLFSDTSFESVRDYLGAFPFVKTIKARIQDATDVTSDKGFHLIHLDTDIYEPTIYVLNTYAEKLAPYGILVLDDYGFTTCPGIEKAVTEFLDNHPGAFTRFELPTGQGILVKTGGN